jgi:hypothetical protein
VGVEDREFEENLEKRRQALDISDRYLRPLLEIST